MGHTHGQLHPPPQTNGESYATAIGKRSCLDRKMRKWKRGGIAAENEMAQPAATLRLAERSGAGGSRCDDAGAIYRLFSLSCHRPLAFILSPTGCVGRSVRRRLRVINLSRRPATVVNGHIVCHDFQLGGDWRERDLPQPTHRSVGATKIADKGSSHWD